MGFPEEEATEKEAREKDATEEEATEEALVRLTEKVAALTAINERLEEQLLEQEPERLAG